MQAYIKSNKVICAVGIYFFCAVLLRILFNVDYTIPCLWKTFLGFECPGCGMTAAFSELVKLNFDAAFKANALLFIVLPASLIYVLTDFQKFKSSYLPAKA
jgi:hypothetical protein